MASGEGAKAKDTVIDYYDIMLIGRTGMGKSTTGDKLIIANPEGRDYRGEQHDDGEAFNKQLKMSDLTMWLVADAQDETERVQTRLKNLIYFRSLEKSHKVVNDMYKRAKKQTFGSQIVSNDTTRVRILDVPGFFGVDIGTANVKNKGTGDKVTRSGLLIMREVLRIQARMRMKFKRIIYFIPDRGTLERSHKVLLMELEQMVHYFGKSIFECMVLVATVSPDVYKFIPESVTPFSDESSTTTRINFDAALVQVLPEGEVLPDGKPPIVFISMHDTCERILEKIKEAPVIYDELRLTFDHRTCIRCGLKAKILKYKNGRKKRVACYAGDDPSVSVAYEDSCCHPLIISKYWSIQKVVGGIAHFIMGNRYRNKWPGFRNPDDEICIDCRQIPSTPGCKRIGSRYRLAEQIFIVDHTPIEPVIVEDQEKILIPLDAEQRNPEEQGEEEAAGDDDVAEPVDTGLNGSGQQQLPGGGPSPMTEEIKPVIHGGRAQTLQIKVDVEPKQRQLDVAASPQLVVGTPDLKG